MPCALTPLPACPSSTVPSTPVLDHIRLPSPPAIRALIRRLPSLCPWPRAPLPSLFPLLPFVLAHPPPALPMLARAAAFSTSFLVTITALLMSPLTPHSYPIAISLTASVPLRPILSLPYPFSSTIHLSILPLAPTFLCFCTL